MKIIIDLPEGVKNKKGVQCMIKDMAEFFGGAVVISEDFVEPEKSSPLSVYRESDAAVSDDSEIAPSDIQKAESGLSGLAGFFIIDEPHVPVISVSEFVELANSLISKLMGAYQSSYLRTLLSDEELEAAPCSNCKSDMVWPFKGVEIHCQQARIEGDCTKTVFSDEEFSEMVKDIIENDGDFTKLLTSEVDLRS